MADPFVRQMSLSKPYLGYVRARWLAGVSCMALAACNAPAQRARLARGNDELRTKNAELERTLAQREETLAAQQRQIATLQAFPPDRPSAAFAPVRIEIAGLSGGSDFDQQPGDDGVTVHVRLYDADGDAVKAPGRVGIQVTDNQTMSAPRVLALCTYEKVEDLRKSWHGRFGTSHYTFRCPFSKDLPPPAGPTVDVRVEFTDYLTGAMLTTVKQVPVSIRTAQSQR